MTGAPKRESQVTLGKCAVLPEKDVVSHSYMQEQPLKRNLAILAVKTSQEDIRRTWDVSARAGWEEAFPSGPLRGEEVRHAIGLSGGQFQESRL